eukprot:3371537-Amphidinium_carterae.1
MTENGGTIETSCVTNFSGVALCCDDTMQHQPPNEIAQHAECVTIDKAHSKQRGQLCDKSALQAEQYDKSIRGTPSDSAPFSVEILGHSTVMPLGPNAHPSPSESSSALDASGSLAES